MPTLALVTAVGALVGAGPALPAPDAPIPTGPQALAGRLESTEARLGRAVRAWVRDGDPSRGEPPEAVTLLALDQQRILRLLTRRPDLERRVLRAQPGGRRRAARTVIAGWRGLRRLTPPTRRAKLRAGRALPADVLLGLYRQNQRRFGVGWHVLAAVNLVETQFNRLRNDSVAGAQGPMQFIPSTWRAYGMGGDIRDPRDAIAGAANYLSASGAPGDYRRALFAYNPSRLYVNAVLGYARIMARRPSAFYELYAWQVFVRTAEGDERRLTGPGRSAAVPAPRDRGQAG